MSGIAGSETVRLTDDYRGYVMRLGLAIGDPRPEPALGEDARGRLRRANRVRQGLADALRPATSPGRS